MAACKKILHSALFYSGFGKLNRLFAERPAGTILAYHRIAPSGEEDALLRDFCVEPSVFEKQIEFLTKHYRITSVDTMVDYLNSGSPLLDGSLAITFDDAYADLYTNAFPVLKKYKVPATVFVSTAFVGGKSTFWWDRLAAIMLKATKKEAVLEFRNMRFEFRINRGKDKFFSGIAQLFKIMSMGEQDNLLKVLADSLGVDHYDTQERLLSWEQIKEMSCLGISFGAHTHTHQALSSLKTPSALREEIARPKEILERYLDSRINAFAYPYGEAGYYDARSQEAVRDAGYTYALSMNQGQVTAGDSTYCLPRIGIGGEDTRESFALKLTGLIPLYLKRHRRHKKERG